ncbi:unnamed protein product [Linum tenue]|uniref:WW domain-containing protein n=1 Tax=Linum tenue TaxID=586396 RepID=A0AAV0II05_9ROSI|nr:unnamed protein product [Linum tenue]
MEFTTELCLAPCRKQHHHQHVKTSSESESSNNNSNKWSIGMNHHSRKRKVTMIEMMRFDNDHDRDRDHVVDLQQHLDQEVKNNRALPLDWEQCLDLHSGTMYYFNRKTSRKSWNRPKDAYHDDENDPNNRSLDLELNISSPSKYYNNVSTDHHQHNMMKLHHHQIPASSPSQEGNFSPSDGGSSRTNDDDDKDNNMVALACLNCHLLVILSKSSPCCPNCKYVHSLPPTIFHHNYPPQPNKAQFPTRPISTLSLLN